MTTPTHAQLVKVPMGKLVQKHQQLKGLRDDIRKEAERKIGPIDDAMAELQSAMLAKLNADGATSQRTEHGTPYIYPQQTGTIVDMNELWAFITANDLPELLQRRLTLSEVTAHNEANPDNPVPGVEVSTIRTVRVKK